MDGLKPAATNDDLRADYWGDSELSKVMDDVNWNAVWQFRDIVENRRYDLERPNTELVKIIRCLSCFVVRLYGEIEQDREDIKKLSARVAALESNQGNRHRRHGRNNERAIVDFLKGHPEAHAWPTAAIARACDTSADDVTHVIHHVEDSGIGWAVAGTKEETIIWHNLITDFANDDRPHTLKHAAEAFRKRIGLLPYAFGMCFSFGHVNMNLNVCNAFPELVRKS